MQLNQTTLRGILAEILSVDESHVVPKQGNWWNPQREKANIANWCSYRIKSNNPRTAPFYVEEKDGEESAAVIKIASVELQFVGPDSEQLAYSVAFWPLRADVKEQLKKIRGAVMLSDFNAVSSVFFQDGNNTVLAWNVPNVQIIWYDLIDTDQKPLKTIDIGGKINGEL